MSSEGIKCKIKINEKTFIQKKPTYLEQKYLCECVPDLPSPWLNRKMCDESIPFKSRFRVSRKEILSPRVQTHHWSPFSNDMWKKVEPSADSTHNFPPKSTGVHVWWGKFRCLKKYWASNSICLNRVAKLPASWVQSCWGDSAQAKRQSPPIHCGFPKFFQLNLPHIRPSDEAPKREKSRGINLCVFRWEGVKGEEGEEAKTTAPLMGDSSICRIQGIKFC